MKKQLAMNFKEFEKLVKGCSKDTKIIDLINK